MALFRLNVVWNDDSNNTLVYKYPFKNQGREVNDKSTITVKESQVAIFVYKGQIADILMPGLHDMKTEVRFPDADHLRRLFRKHQAVHEYQVGYS